MAESLTDRLKRIAAEKNASALATKGQVTDSVTEVSGVNNVSDLRQGDGINAPISEQVSSGTGQGVTTQRQAAEPISVPEAAPESSGTETEQLADTCHDIIPVESNSGSNHPLVMEFAELSQALDNKDPEFKIILRKIHQQLGKDPDLVTQMTEDEIGLLVGGMIVFANAEIVEPAKVKSVKAKVAAAKKQVISADDL